MLILGLKGLIACMTGAKKGRNGEISKCETRAWNGKGKEKVALSFFLSRMRLVLHPCE